MIWVRGPAAVYAVALLGIVVKAGRHTASVPVPVKAVSGSHVVGIPVGAKCMCIPLVAPRDIHGESVTLGNSGSTISVSWPFCFYSCPWCGSSIFTAFLISSSAFISSPISVGETTGHDCCWFFIFVRLLLLIDWCPFRS